MPNQIWNLFVELRKELLESQKIRSQIIGFKITFITATIGLMATHIMSLDKVLFIIPAFAAICFDFIICSYSFSIKRIGCYTRDHIEPALKAQGDIPHDFIPWQEFLTDSKTRQELAFYGNIGLTLLTVVIGTISLFFPFRLFISSSLLFALLVFVVMDILAHLSLRKLGKFWKDI